MQLLALRPYRLGVVTKLDDEDWDNAIEWSWSIKMGGSRRFRKMYAYRKQQHNQARTYVLLHRWIMNTPDGMDVDHINGDSLDNQRFNLRNATRSQNVSNQQPRSRGVHGFFGVYNHGHQTKWYARIVQDQTFIHIGVFNTPVEAALAYDRKAIELRGPITHLNFPQQHV